MKVFISWSGNRSRAVGEVLNDWIKCVLQAARPWMSTRNIDRGALWFHEISEQLKDTAVGIVCLTKDNKLAPWILFEAGALAKGLTANRICTFLVDLEPADIQDPLAQFNHTKPDKAGLRNLVLTLNVCLGENALDERVVENVFETYWPQFERDFNNALEQNPVVTTMKKADKEDLLAEIAESTRALHNRIARLEQFTSESSANRNFWRRGASRIPTWMRMLYNEKASPQRFEENRRAFGMSYSDYVEAMHFLATETRDFPMFDMDPAATPPPTPTPSPVPSS